VPDLGELWRTKKRSLAAARKALRAGEPDGLHDLRVALRRICVAADALNHRKLARRSRRIVRSLSDLRRLEVERQLLARVRELALLSSEAAAGLEARWVALLRAGEREAARLSDGARMRRLLRQLSKRTRGQDRNALGRLRKRRRRAERNLAPLSENSSDRNLHRYRLRVKRARYLAEDLALAGEPGLEKAIAREKETQEALGRWSDTRLFRLRLCKERRGAENRGAVSLALELDRVIRTLEPTVESARRQALDIARRGQRVLSFRRVTA
jgi:CHAD domain-containing protein